MVVAVDRVGRDPAGSGHALGPPERTAAIDAAQRVVQAGIARPAQTAWDVAPSAIRVAVTALWDEEDARAVGWHGSTVLRQVASQTLLGDGVVVRRPGKCHT